MSLSSLLLAGRFAQMTSFFSLAFLGGFLPAVLLLYTGVPARMKRYFLVAANYLFFWFISGTLVVFLFLSTLSVHYFGLWLGHLQALRDEELGQLRREEKKSCRESYRRKQRGVLLFATVCCVGILLTLKYSGFFMINLNRLLSLIGVSVQLAVPSFLVPVGISFFTMQALSYLFDVYRETVAADDNLLRLALYMSFFPQIVEGPICRYRQTAGQLWDVETVRFENLTGGLQRILFGLMKKLVVADRLNPLIECVFSNYGSYPGAVNALAAVAYTVQLYMEFSGTMDVVCGVAETLGVTMPENFQRPFFSRSVSEFWKRWHITLGEWFRDYIFYPVVSAKRLKRITVKARKKLGNHFGSLISGGAALFCVWILNGLWHGAAWNYIFFGMYHFMLILGGNMIEPASHRFTNRFHIRTEGLPWRLMQMARTALLVVAGELFFRAEGLRAGLGMFRSILTDFHLTAENLQLIFDTGVDGYDFVIVGVALLVVLAVSILQERGMGVRALLAGRRTAVRWAVWYALILFIVVFGAYGVGYIPVDPIYANF